MPSTSAVPTQLRQFLLDCAARLQVLGDDPKALEAAEALTQAVADSAARDCPATTVPCLSSIHQASDTALSRQVIEMSPSLNWIPSHRLTDNGETAALMRADAMLDLGGVIAGLLYVGPGETYPEHEHEPQELYMTLSGLASWRHGGNTDYEDIGPDRCFYNKPFDRHGVRAGKEPMLALYVLWDFANAGLPSSASRSS